MTPKPRPAPVPFNPAFLGAIYYAKVALHFEVIAPLRLPAYPGTTLRGSFGRVLHRRLCRARPPCPAACLNPGACGYYALFEQDRLAPGGPNIPKPLVLDPPLPAELEQIVLGGDVVFPYRLSPAPGAPVLETSQQLVLEPGAAFSVQLTVFGNRQALLPSCIASLAASDPRVGNGHFRLRRAYDSAAGHSLLFDSRCPALPLQQPARQILAPSLNALPTSVRRARLFFLTPARRQKSGRICLEPSSFWDGFLDAALARASQIHDLYCAPPGFRSPFMNLPANPARLAVSRLFHYRLPRLSIQQDAWMDFDGLVGAIDLEGDLGPVFPLLKALEILHFGQKASMGLGRVSCVYLE